MLTVRTSAIDFFDQKAGRQDGSHFITKFHFVASVNLKTISCFLLGLS